jgi:branched-chain amino acid aminotransferase
MKVLINKSGNPVKDELRDERVKSPGFGKYYTDHMVIAEWDEKTGWSDAQLKAYGPLITRSGNCGISLWPRDF